jgi:hypothetical protein
LFDRVNHLCDSSHKGVVHEFDASAKFFEMEDCNVLKEFTQSNFELGVVLGDFLFDGESEAVDLIEGEIE